MNISFKNSLDKSYLIVESEEIRTNDYTMKMLSANRIEGFCLPDVKQIDEKSIYHYDISHKESLKEIYRYSRMTKKDIVKIFFELKDVTEMSKKYLLNPEKIVLKLDYIYRDMMTGKLNFCYYPLKEEDYYASIRQLMNEIIRYVDHSDKPTVIMAYGIHQLVQGQNVTLSDMLKFIESPQFKQKEGEGEYRMPFEDDTICILKNNNFKEIYDRKKEGDKVKHDIDNGMRKGKGVNKLSGKLSRLKLQIRQRICDLYKHRGAIIKNFLK